MMVHWFDNIAASVPQLKRGIVWCRACGYSQRVESADAMRHGWPKHCGYTMTIDSPDEQAALKVHQHASSL